MAIRNKKYHGCLNTFTIIDDLGLDDYTNLAKELCEQNDTDGFIVCKLNPLEMVFYNRDGSRGSMCGNGMRSFIKYLLDEQKINPETNEMFEVVTLAGKINVWLLSINPYLVKVDLGCPIIDSNKMDMTEKEIFPLLLKDMLIYNLFIGTHHSVIFVEEYDMTKLDMMVDVIKKSNIYKKFTNIDFVKVIDSDNIYVKTYERGVGYTKACGTGSTASAYVAHALGKVNNKVFVHNDGGDLIIQVEDKCYMIGSAEEY